MTITIEQIQIAVADFFNLSLEEVTLHSRTRVLTFPRPIAMFLARQFTGASLHEIARHFGCKSYKIVRSSIARIDEQRRTDAAMDRILRELTETLNTNTRRSELSTHTRAHAEQVSGTMVGIRG
jgi:chromosomal replication initiator protein